MSTKETETTTGAATSPPPKRQKTSSRSSSSSSTAAAPIFSSIRNINKVPVEVWKEHICQKFLNLTELSILRRCHTFFEKYWQNVMRQNLIRVPQGCSTVQKAMALAVIFSERKEYTAEDVTPWVWLNRRQTEYLLRSNEFIQVLQPNSQTTTTTCVN